MNLNIKLETVLPIGAALLGSFGLGYGIAANIKSKQLADKLNTSVDKIIASKNIDIPQSMIEESVNRVAENYIKKAIDKTANRIVEDADRTIRNKVSVVVEAERNNIHNKVQTHSAEIVRKIDTRSLREDIIYATKNKISNDLEDVVSDAKKTAQKRFEEEFETILKKYNDRLDDVSKIYSSIANHMEKK